MIRFLSGTPPFLLVFACVFKVNAQLPQDLPYDSKPVDFSDPVNIVLYIAIPLLIIVLYIFWRRRFRKK